MKEISKTYTVGDVILKRGSDISIDEIYEIFKQTPAEEPLSPVESSVIVDKSEDNKHLEIHIDKHLLDRISIETELSVKIADSKKHKITLDGGEVELCKGLRFWYEFNLQGDTCIQAQEIYFAKVPTSANLVAGPAMPDPALFKNIIIPIYDKTTNELYLFTNGSSVPSDVKIIDVVGLI